VTIGTPMVIFAVLTVFQSKTVKRQSNSKK